MTWNIVETLQLVELRHGEALSQLAASSLHSAHQRVRFAHVHYHTVKDLLAEFARQAPEGAVLGLAWARDDETREEYFHLRDKMSANAFACVQSIHAVADLLTHGAFFALRLERHGKPLKTSQIDAKRTLERLDLVPAFATTASMIRRILDDAAFRHVDALSNQAKHRSVVPIGLNEDATGTREPRFELRFSAFRRDGEVFAEAEVGTLLSRAYDSVSHGLVDVGNELTRLLKQPEA